jgi:hypothetical protein
MNNINGLQQHPQRCLYIPDTVVRAIEENTRATESNGEILKSVKDQNDKYFRWVLAAILIIALGKDGIAVIKDIIGHNNTANAEAAE